MPVEDLVRSQLQSEEFTDQHSSHFKLCISINFKSLQKKKSAPSFELPIGTVMTKARLFHAVERKMYHAQQTFKIN